MNELEPLLQRITVTVDVDYEPGYEHIGAGLLLDVVSHLAHDGIEPRWLSLEITGPTTTP
jgi:hypothetical protein